MSLPPLRSPAASHGG
jgi:hypothetical protein